MTTAELAARVEALEKAVERLQAQLTTATSAPARWWVKGAGRFANDPVFDEIVRLGREYRESLRPRKGKTRRDHS